MLGYGYYVGGTTVDGQYPETSKDDYPIPIFIGFQPFQVVQDFYHQQYVRVSLNRTHFFGGGSSNANFWGVNPLGVPCWVCEYNAPVCGSLLSLFLLVYPKSSFLTLSCPLSFFHRFFLSLFLIRYRSGPFYSTAWRYHNVVLGRCFRYTFLDHTQKIPS